MPTNLTSIREAVAEKEVDFYGKKFNVKYWPTKITRKSLDEIGGETLASALVRTAVGWDLVQTVEYPVDKDGDEILPADKAHKKVVTKTREEPLPFTVEVLEDLGYDLMRCIWQAIIEGRSPNATKSSD